MSSYPFIIFLLIIPSYFLFISRQSPGYISSVPGNGPDQAGCSQHTIHNSQHSFTFFRVFSFSVHQFIVFFTTFATSPTATAHPRIVSIIFQFLCSMVAFTFCRICFRPITVFCQSCTISRVTRVPISTIVEIISTSLVCCSVSWDYLPVTGSVPDTYFR